MSSVSSKGQQQHKQHVRNGNRNLKTRDNVKSTDSGNIRKNDSTEPVLLAVATKHKAAKMKKRKKKTGKKAVDPFIEHLNAVHPSCADPKMLEELIELLSDTALNPEIREHITVFLEKVKEAKQQELSVSSSDLDISEDHCDHTVDPEIHNEHATDPDFANPGAEATDGSCQEEKHAWIEQDLGNPDRLKEFVQILQKEMGKELKAKAIAADARRKIDLFHREVACFAEACVATGMVGTNLGVQVRITVYSSVNSPCTHVYKIAYIQESRFLQPFILRPP